MKLNGKEYTMPQINTFMDVIELEDKGINVTALVDGSFFDINKPIKSIVMSFALLTGLSVENAATEIQEEIQNGTDINELAERFLDEVKKIQDNAEKTGFLSVKEPQDHKKKAPAKKKAVKTAEEK